jgi:hypothetical protein
MRKCLLPVLFSVLLGIAGPSTASADLFCGLTLQGTPTEIMDHRLLAYRTLQIDGMNETAGRVQLTLEDNVNRKSEVRSLYWTWASGASSIRNLKLGSYRELGASDEKPASAELSVTLDGRISWIERSITENDSPTYEYFCEIPGEYKTSYFEDVTFPVPGTPIRILERAN